jgi:uncharacterized protein YciI
MLPGDYTNRRYERTIAMPLFCMIGRDGPQGLELRKLHREAHLANVAPLKNAGQMAYAGPLIDEENLPCGSILIFEADDLDSARRFAASDPYVVEGIFESFELFETAQVLPRSWWG